MLLGPFREIGIGMDDDAGQGKKVGDVQMCTSVCHYDPVTKETMESVDALLLGGVICCLFAPLSFLWRSFDVNAHVVNKLRFG